MDAQIVEQILNLVYFLVGLAVGLFGLWQNQKYFLAQQQDRFDQIHAELTEIRERFATMAEITSEKAFARENRLLSLAVQQKAVESATEEATVDIRSVVVGELQRAGVPDAMQRTTELEKKVSEIVARSAKRVFAARQDAELYAQLLLLSDSDRRLLRDLGEQPFSAPQLGRMLGLGWSDAAYYAKLKRWSEASLVERSEREMYRVRTGVQEMLAEIGVGEEAVVKEEEFAP